MLSVWKLSIAAALALGGSAMLTACGSDDAAGTAATGQCAPPRSDRLVDSAIWIFTLGVLIAVVVLVVRGSRQPSEVPAEDR